MSDQQKKGGQQKKPANDAPDTQKSSQSKQQNNSQQQQQQPQQQKQQQPQNQQQQNQQQQKQSAPGSPDSQRSSQPKQQNNTQQQQQQPQQQKQQQQQNLQQQNQQQQKQTQQMQQSQVSQQQQKQKSNLNQPTKLQEKQQTQAMENAEINEYIKSYLKFNTFQNTFECFEAEINAKRMSSKLQDKKLLKDPHIVEDTPRLYQMLKNEESRTSRERKLEQNMKILNQKYLEMLQASRSLFSISVKLLTDYMQASPQSEENIEGYKSSIGQYRRLVLEEGKPSEKQAPNNEQVKESKENIQNLSRRIDNIIKAREPDNQNEPIRDDEEDTSEELLARQLKSELIKLRLMSLETGQTYRQEYLNNLIKLDILDIDNLGNSKHYIMVNLSKQFIIKYVFIQIQQNKLDLISFFLIQNECMDQYYFLYTANIQLFKEGINKYFNNIWKINNIFMRQIKSKKADIQLKYPISSIESCIYIIKKQKYQKKFQNFLQNQQQKCFQVINFTRIGYYNTQNKDEIQSDFNYIIYFKSFDHFIKHQIIALISIVCSIRAGRMYILSRDTHFVILKKIIKVMRDQEKGSVTQRFCLSVLQKISLHDEVTPILLQEKIHNWLVELMKTSIAESQDSENRIHVFVLEYASATLTNILSESEVMETFHGQQQLSTQFLDNLLKCLSYQNSILTNKQILKSLSFFTKDKFNQSLLETSYDEKINQFLDSVSKNTDEDYKTQVLTYHASIYTTEVNKQGLHMEQADEYERGMKKKYDGDDSYDEGYDDPDQIIIFEHFNDELTDELLKGNYNR